VIRIMRALALSFGKLRRRCTPSPDDRFDRGARIPVSPCAATPPARVWQDVGSAFVFTKQIERSFGRRRTQVEFTQAILSGGHGSVFVSSEPNWRQWGYHPASGAAIASLRVGRKLRVARGVVPLALGGP
jgi:hypothetical protein